MTATESVLEVRGPVSERGAVTRLSRAAVFRDVLHELLDREHVRGGLLVAPDGFVMAANLADGVEQDALAALAATLGRHLELGAARLDRDAFAVGLFEGEHGALFLAGTPVGFVAVLTDLAINATLFRGAMKSAAASIALAWEVGERRAFA